MVSIKEKNKKHGNALSVFTRRNRSTALLVLLLLTVGYIRVISKKKLALKSQKSSLSQISPIPPGTQYKVDDSCKSLPFIRPSGSYFLNSGVKKADSDTSFSPSFKVGSFMGAKATIHMGGEGPHFELIKEVLVGRKSGSVAFDIGANQGFYTYYLAALGMEVHAFEINEQNFIALQHGAEFNSQEIAQRVHVYPVGLGEMNGRIGMSGSGYGGFLTKTSTSGSILGASVDCFMYHNIKQFDLSDIAFVKIDVEGFEIAVLKGGYNSLFNTNTNIGGMLMEVGPSRWSRAGVNFTIGLKEMKRLSTLFKRSYLLVRVSGGHSETCPKEFGNIVADKNPRILMHVQIHKVETHEWEPLLKEMESKDFDCNFFYTNNDT